MFRNTRHSMPLQVFEVISLESEWVCHVIDRLRGWTEAMGKPKLSTRIHYGGGFLVNRKFISIALLARYWFDSTSRGLINRQSINYSCDSLRSVLELFPLSFEALSAQHLLMIGTKSVCFCFIVFLIALVHIISTFFSLTLSGVITWIHERLHSSCWRLFRLTADIQWFPFIIHHRLSSTHLLPLRTFLHTKANGSLWGFASNFTLS